jgi:hypothetical protein
LTLSPLTDTVVALEVAELETFRHLYRAAGASLVEACGLTVAEAAGARSRSNLTFLNISPATRRRAT